MPSESFSNMQVKSTNSALKKPDTTFKKKREKPNANGNSHTPPNAQKMNFASILKKLGKWILN